MTVIVVEHKDKEAFQIGADKAREEGHDLKIEKIDSNDTGTSYKVTGTHKALFFFGVYYNEVRG